MHGIFGEPPVDLVQPTSENNGCNQNQVARVTHILSRLEVLHLTQRQAVWQREQQSNFKN